MAKRTPEEQLLFDIFGNGHEELCPHAASVGKNGSGWTRDADPKSPYYGCFVHSDANCRRPAHMKEAING